MNKLSLKREHDLFILLALIIPFYLNDFPFIILQRSFGPFYFVDVFTRVLTLTILVFAVEWDEIKSVLPRPKWTMLIALLIMLGLEFGTKNVIDTFFGSTFSGTILYSFPEYPNQFLRYLDLTFGIFLVSISEELIFRFYLVKFFKSRSCSLGFTVLASSLIFATMHWATGVVNVIHCFLFGVMVSTYYVKTKNLITCMVLHTVVNFLIFSYGF